MTQLYVLADQYKFFNQYVEEELERDDLTEDDLQMFIDTLEQIQDPLENKVENIIKFMKNLEGDIKAFKEEENRIATRRKTMENKSDGLKEYLRTTLISAGIDKVTAGTFKVRVQKSNASVNVYNEEKIPEQFKIQQPAKIDKKQIMDVLKSGGLIDGAELITENKHLVIS